MNSNIPCGSKIKHKGGDMNIHRHMYLLVSLQIKAMYTNFEK